MEVSAGGDAEAGEDVAEVVLDGLGGDVEDGGDLFVGVVAEDQGDDVLLATGQVRVAGSGVGEGRSGRVELAAVRMSAEGGEGAVGRGQLVGGGGLFAEGK